MKRSFALLVTLGGLVYAFATSSPAFAKQEESASGSIRPSGKVAPADLPGLAKINFQQAYTAAVAKVPGNVIKAELEVEDGNLMYSFEIVGADKKIKEVEIDAGNGKVLNVEDEEKEKETKGEKK